MHPVSPDVVTIGMDRNPGWGFQEGVLTQKTRIPGYSLHLDIQAMCYIQFIRKTDLKQK